MADAPQESPGPHGRTIAVGQSPDGKALKFVHRGSYDESNQTYEAITNYLDEKGLDARTADRGIHDRSGDRPQDMLVVNIFVPLKCDR